MSFLVHDFSPGCLNSTPRGTKQVYLMMEIVPGREDIKMMFYFENITIEYNRKENHLKMKIDCYLKRNGTVRFSDQQKKKKRTFG